LIADMPLFDRTWMLACDREPRPLAALQGEVVNA
jgi:hypothetical protein